MMMKLGRTEADWEEGFREFFGLLSFAPTARVKVATVSPMKSRRFISFLSGVVLIGLILSEEFATLLSYPFTC
jgi:hypothetical protein